MNNTTHFYPNLDDRAEIFCVDDKHYQEKMELLKGVMVGSRASESQRTCECFRRDDTYNGINAPYYIMYKLEPVEHDGLVYEFLVEYQIGDPNTGIYFGCKMLNRDVMTHFKNGDIAMATQLTQKMVNRADKEWRIHLKNAVAVVLNNSYPDKEFHLRFCHSDNANDGTYWPFWIRLNEEEDIVTVAANAVKLIKNIHLTHFSVNDVLPSAHPKLDDTSGKHTGRKKSASNARYFSNAAYHECRILHSTDKDTSYLDDIIKELCNSKTISRSEDIYECAYIINEEFSVLDFCKELDKLRTKKNGEKLKLCWTALEKIFLTAKGERVKLDKGGKQKLSSFNNRRKGHNK